MEILEPDGLGLVSAHLGRKGPGVLALGFGVGDVPELRERLRGAGVVSCVHGPQAFIASDQGIDLPGTHFVFTPAEPRLRVGTLGRLVGATYLLREPWRAADAVAALLGLAVQEIESDGRQRGVEMALARVDADRPDHLAFAWPFDGKSAIGRFFASHGPGFYLVSAEAPDLDAIEGELEKRQLRFRRSGPMLLVPPSALGGVRLHATEDPGDGLPCARAFEIVEE